MKPSHFLLGLSLIVSSTPLLAANYRVLGQPDLASASLATRCANGNAQFNKNPDFNWAHGPSGVLVTTEGRLFVTDFGGNRVLSWPSVDALNACDPADAVIQAHIGFGLNGPEALAYDPESKTLFIADTLNHVVDVMRLVDGAWARVAMLGIGNTPGAGMNQFNYPRGLAVDAKGRLFVADDYNHKIKIFTPPFVDGQSASDSIGAGNNGGFAQPKAIAISGDTLFVADYGVPGGDPGRVLRFTGPFDNPATTYTASGIFTGLTNPVDLAVHPDGSLLVTDQGNTRIARYNDAVFSNSKAAPDSNFSEHMNQEPLGVATDRSGRIYIADFRAYRVLIRDEFVRTTPVNANATPQTAVALENLHQRVNQPDQRVLLGQQLKTYDPAAWDESMQSLRLRGLPLPRVVGGDLTELKEAWNRDIIDGMVAYGRAGSIVTLGWHPTNPVTGGAYNSPALTAAQLLEITNPQSLTGRVWQAQIDEITPVLQRFRDEGIPVILRPLHEQNSHWFWWGHDGSNGAERQARQAAWVGLWRALVTELTVRKGMNNLLFSFSPSVVSYNGIVPPMTYYPGAAWTDITGLDVYDNELDLAGDARGLQHYNALVNTGKPFTLGEFGQTVAGNGPAANWDARLLANRINDSYPRTVLALSWVHNPPETYALADLSNIAEMLNNPLFDNWPSAGMAGACGSANNTASLAPPASNLCTSGNASAVTSSASQYSWSCAGSSTAQCSAPRHYTLTGNSGAGGAVNINPSQTSFAYNSSVSLTATPEAGKVFGTWGGDCTGTRTNCTLVMSANRSYNASFSVPTENHFSRMYLAAFLRAADMGGMNYWSNQINNEGQSYQRVGGTIFSLSVVTAIYPAGMADQAFVEAIYNNVFGRASDAEGLNYWTNELITLRNTYLAQGSGYAAFEARGQLVVNMMNAGLGTAEGTPGKAYIDNRFLVALYASERQRVLGKEIPPATLRSISDSVTADPATIAPAKAAIDAALNPPPPAPVIQTKTLTSARAIAAWKSTIPAGEKRPVIVFLPGWGGVGNVDATRGAQNDLLANEGYVTLAIGFQQSGAAWNSDILAQTLSGLNKLCADASIPAQCGAIALLGSSYGGSQNMKVIDHLIANGYNLPGQKRALAFLSEDTGYAAPGQILDFNTGAFQRNGLANTAQYSVAMIENLGDTTFPVNECTWGNCGARTLAQAHYQANHANVYSHCPAGGEHGTRGYASWDAWVISALKTMIHVNSGVPTFTGYTPPSLVVGNNCR